MTTIDRARWNEVRPSGPPVETRTTVRTDAIDIESTDGLVEVSVLPWEDGIDVRVGDLQLVVKQRHVVLLQQHLPYPIREWTVLWEGDLA